MKYESNILERLIKTYGVVGNPKYVSEIIKQFIIHGKECYPNLFTYQSDWLSHIDEFGLTNDYVVTYTGQRFYAPNTMERPFKRAILKGQTLVNHTRDNLYNTIEPEGVKTIATNIQTLKNNTEYIAIFRLLIGSDTRVLLHLFDNKWEYIQNISSNISPTKNYIKFTTPSSREVGILQLENQGTASFDATDLMIIKYQDGMENWDIPYFEGMQSVKMPVLTTTGKNLFDGKFKKGVALGGSGAEAGNPDRASSDFIEVKPSTQYVLSGVDIRNILAFDEDKTVVGNLGITGQITTPPNARYIRFTCVNGDNLNVMLEFGTVATTYEPFKSNILTTSEEVELRGIGDVRDTLDCLTGEITYYIKDGLLNGTETWTGVFNSKSSVFSTKSFNIVAGSEIIYDNLPDGVNYISNNNGVLKVSTTSVFASVSVNNFIKKLKENPIPFMYCSNDVVIKTVDLNIKDHNQQKVERLSSFEGGTHFDTTSQTGTLLPTLEVDVVVDLEETLMTCSTEGNTM